MYVGYILMNKHSLSHVTLYLRYYDLIPLSTTLLLWSPVATGIITMNCNQVPGYGWRTQIPRNSSCSGKGFNSALYVGGRWSKRSVSCDISILQLFILTRLVQSFCINILCAYHVLHVAAVFCIFLHIECMWREQRCLQSANELPYTPFGNTRLFDSYICILYSVWETL